MDKIFAFVSMKIIAGQEAAFREAASICFEAAKADPAGTDGYEWFISPDGTEVTVLEIYDDAAALAHHGTQVRKFAQPLMQHVESHIRFAGGMPPEVLAAYQARRPNVTYAGPRLLGRRHQAAPGQPDPQSGKRIFAVARFTIHPGKEQEFLALAEDCFALVQANEPGTTGYEWFLEGNNCTTLDIYEDMAALAAHRANAGPIMAKILRLVDSEVQIFGALPEAVIASFKPGLGMRYGGTQFQGLL